MLKISKAMVAHLIAAPIVLGITAGSAWVARHFPGLPTLNNEEVSGFGLLVGTAAASYALHYLKGLREWERLEAEGTIAVGEEATEAPAVEVPTPPTREGADKAIAELPTGSLDVAPEAEGGAPGGGE